MVMAKNEPRVVLVHDWLTGMRGGEKVLEAMCRLWPGSPLFTLLHRRGSLSETLESHRPATSFLQYLPRVHRYYRYLLPLMPWAARWKLPECDVVVSSSHCVAKAAMPPPGVPHVCYCHTPMRYAWHMRDAYFGKQSRGGLLSALSPSSLKARARDRLLGMLRDWDRRTAERVTHFIANSRAVQQRIRDCYGRDSVVIHPPVDTDYFTPGDETREDYYLAMSAFAPYKRIDLAILACNRLQRRLVIIGAGQDEKRLRSLAGPTVHFLGWQPDEVIRDHLRRCQALLFPGEEDFGIVPVEAQACGTPVIAFAQGGATETVIPLANVGERLSISARPSGAQQPLPTIAAIDAGPTGLWFADQSRDCLVEAMEVFEKHRAAFDPQVLRRQALRFHRTRFTQEMSLFVAEVLQPAQPYRRAA